MKLWTGRLSGSLDEIFAKMNSSLPFDQRMSEVDVYGSIAWAKSLNHAGLLKDDEAQMIMDGLQTILQEFQENKFAFHAGDEDIHTAVERRLTELIGPTAGKLHTGRSRNDQVATDFRLWVMHKIPRINDLIVQFQEVLVARAEGDWGIILPGYTHLQQAQPIALSHWWLWHFWALQRDHQRFLHLQDEIAVMPLGCGALAGTGFKLDRFELAEALGFREPFPNSLDAISDRDFAAGFLFNAVLLGIHISRMAEILILFSTQEFNFISLADEFSTGSSLMPQKKNPDPLELARGKSGVLAGKLMGLLMTLKALPSTYDKDLQEDKQPVFEAVDILEMLLPVMAGLVSTLTVNRERMLSVINEQVLATDLADYLVERGVPFRQAHSAVGLAVKKAEEFNLSLSDLPLEEWKSIHLAFDEALFENFNMAGSIERRCSFGGTASDRIREQIQLAKTALKKNCNC